MEFLAIKLGNTKIEVGKSYTAEYIDETNTVTLPTRSFTVEQIIPISSGTNRQEWWIKYHAFGISGTQSIHPLEEAIKSGKVRLHEK